MTASLKVSRAALLLILLGSTAGSLACGASPTAPGACTVTVSAPATVAAAGGTVTITVTASTGSCVWQSTTTASFISLTSGTSGTGNGSVGFTVAANTGAERTGTITIGGVAVTITQAGLATLGAPIAQSPINGALVASVRPTLIAINGPATAVGGAVTYRFEVSADSAFPAGLATIVQDNVPQGIGQTTSWTLAQDLAANTTYFWRSRATNGTLTSPFSAAASFITPIACTFTVSPSTIAVNANSTTSSVALTASASSCAWSATTTSGFITVTTPSGTGSATVGFAIAGNNAGGSRSGTITVGGQTVTINQSGGLVASFALFNPAAQFAETMECRFRAATSTPSTCYVESTSSALSSTTIINYSWTVSYQYGVENNVSQSGPSNRITFSHTCGGSGSTDAGATGLMTVTLTVTDNQGTIATAISGTGSQPALSIRAWTCGL